MRVTGWNLLQRASAAVLVVLAAIVVTGGVAPSAALASTPGCGTLSGAGTAGSPCLITDAADLDTAMSLINGDTSDSGYSTEDYQLTSDINYSTDSATDGKWGGFDYFAGVFDGAGHTISNVTYTTDATDANNTYGKSANGQFAFFRLLNGATVENLTFANVTAANPGSVAAPVSAVADNSTITNVSVVDPTMSGTTATGVTGWLNGNTAAGSAGTATVTNVSVVGGSITGTSYTGGVTELGQANANITDTFIDTSLTNDSGSAPSKSDPTGGLIAYNGATGTTSMANDVVIASITYTDAATNLPISTSDESFAGPSIGWGGNKTFGSYDGWTITNLPSDITYSSNLSGSALAGTGTAVSAQALATQATYQDSTTTALTDPANSAVTYQGVGWDFTTPIWAWDGVSEAPYLDLGGSVTVPTVALTTNALSYYTTDAPTSAATILTALGATPTPATATVSLDLEGNTLNSFTTPGTYNVEVDVANNGVAGTPQPATITVTAPPVTVSLSKTALTYVSNDPPASTAAILTALGVTATPATATVSLDLEGNTLSTFNSPGTYQVEVDASSGGVDATPQQATITIEPSPVISTALTSIDYAVGADISEQQLLSDVGATLSDSGTLTADLSQVDFAVASASPYKATISATDDNGYSATPVTIEVNIISPPGGTTGNPPPDVTPGTVTITGAPQVGSQLTADPGTWTPSGTPSYQWLENGAPLSGETAATYTPQPSDAGQLLQVAVTEDGVTADSGPETISAATLTGTAPTMSGTPQVGDTLTATVSWTPNTAATAYQWLRNGEPISGATGATYTLQPADADQQISVAATGGLYGYTNLTLTSESEQARPASASGVTPGDVTIDGTAEVDQTLTADPGTWSPVGTPSYQWVENGSPVSGATSATYTPGSSEAGDTLYVAVTEDGETVDSAPVVIASDVITGQVPTISGGTTVGDLLTATGAAWDPSTATTTYQWYRNGVAIPDATQASYTLQAADANAAITVEVTGTLSGFASVTLASAAVTAQPASSQAVTPGAVAITGTPQVGSTLTASPGSWSPAGTAAYQWLENGKAIQGATSATYDVQAADGGQSLQLAVTEDGETVYSSPVTVEYGALKGGTPVVSGTPTVGDTLSVNGVAWTPAAASTAYQWLRNGNPISGATGATYKLTAADAGQEISVSVTGSEAGSSELTLTSAQVKAASSGTAATKSTSKLKTLKAAKPKIDGTATVGATLKLTLGKWTAKTKFTYQWYANGKKIKGATKATVEVPPNDKGKRISVQVKGTLKGYVARTETSASTKPAKHAKASKRSKPAKAAAK